MECHQLGGVIPCWHVSYVKCRVMVLTFLFVSNETVSIYDLFCALSEDLRLLVPEGLFFLSLLLLHPWLFFFEESEFESFVDLYAFGPVLFLHHRHGQFEIGMHVIIAHCYFFLLFFFSFSWIISFFKAPVLPLHSFGKSDGSLTCFSIF